MRASYDTLPYESHAISATHIEVLAVEAMVAGLSPTPVDRCRVLELGCASGGNLLPMAEQFPGSEFVGIDLSPIQIAEGQRLAEQVGLRNVKLLAMDVMQAGAELGQFDFIIAHGLYSWVPPAVQRKVLEIISAHLASSGAAYISYDTFPGWHPRLMLREMLQRHTRSAGQQADAVSRACHFLEALVTTDARDSGPNAGILTDDARKLLQMGDSYIAHEPLTDYLEAIYFEEFVSRLESRGLTYLAECRPRLSRMALARVVVRHFPELAGDWVGREQYVDFFLGSQFRRSAIAHAAATPQREHDPSLIERLMMRALCKPATDTIDLSPGAVVVFDGGATGKAGLTDPASKAIVVAICRRWPELVSLDEALADARAQLRTPDNFASPGTAARQEICRALMNCRDGGLIELRARKADFTTRVSERPVASPL
ncbi:MAG TPA: class I SAM-dependent methyltransferase, partial [Burkholderiales bacterium]|nr:class I SAM-dependent methyltransferase [Burkholderiales bacterium]